MCRLLMVSAKKSFNPEVYLKPFASMCKESKEYQGHGWGFAALIDNEWSIYKNIKPIWEDELNSFDKTKVILVHARSAFEDKDIAVENNMPFIINDIAFIFNGELRGVKLKINGRIGAEKLFNFLLKFYNGNMTDAAENIKPIIIKRSNKIRAMNFIAADMSGAVINSFFTEDDSYFTMRKLKEPDRVIICSEQLNIDGNWESINNNSIEEMKWL